MFGGGVAQKIDQYIIISSDITIVIVIICASFIAIIVVVVVDLCWHQHPKDEQLQHP